MAKLGGEKNIEATAPKQPGVRAKSSQISPLKAVLITILILLVGSIITLTVLYQTAVHSSKGPGESATAFIVAVQNDDVKAAYELTAPSFQDQVTIAEFSKALIAQNATINTGKIVIAGTKNKASDGHLSATVGVNIGIDADAMSATVELERDQSKWLITNVSFGKGPYTGSTLDNSQ
jgi:hypothetical protein